MAITCLQVPHVAPVWVLAGVKGYNFLFVQPPKQDKKKDAGKSKKDKDPVNKSGGKAKKKVCRGWFSSRIGPPDVML